MPYIIAGLGNPGPEYVGTRHNTGRIVLEHICAEYKGGDFEFVKKINALVCDININNEKVKLVSPETFMNKSGTAIVPLVKNVKAAAKLIIIYDDFQLPLGRMKISFNRSSGGHNGLESIIQSLKTEAFVRLRIGTAPANTKGDAKVPHGDDKIERFILGKYKNDELKSIKKVSKLAAEAVEMIIKDGREKAMSVFNGKS